MVTFYDIYALTEKKKTKQTNPNRVILIQWVTEDLKSVFTELTKEI